MPIQLACGGYLSLSTKARGQVVRLDSFSFAQDHGLTERILQLTHVLRPIVLNQSLPRLGADRRDAQTELAVQPIQQMIEQQGNIISSVSQGRKMNPDDVKSPVEIVAELALMVCSRSLCVAATTCTSTGVGLRAPNRVTAR
jgi:hypothetical protein